MDTTDALTRFTQEPTMLIELFRALSHEDAEVDPAYRSSLKKIWDSYAEAPTSLDFDMSRALMDIGAVASSDLEGFDEARNLITRDELNSAATSFYRTGLLFVRGVLTEVRDVICKNPEKYADLNPDNINYARDLATAVSAAVLTSVGITGPTALGLSVLILLVLARASHTTFCKMTDMQIVSAIQDLSKPKREP